MKKIYAITLAFLILISGIHLSLASHICGGEVAARKISLTGENATCGMESDNLDCTIHNLFASNCCENIVIVYSVDNNYNISTFKVKEITKNLLQVFYVPVSISLYSFNATSSLSNNTIPPDIALTSAVSLANICIFRI